MPVDEPELDALLRRLVPDFEKRCVGATPEEVAKIQAIAGRPLPPFYRWFLEKMGRDIGPFARVRQDFSIERVLAAYDEGFVERDPGRLLIAEDKDQDDPTLDFYELDRPARGDAMVMTARGYDGNKTPTYETFREMFAHDNLVEFRIRLSPVYCDGRFRDAARDVAAKLDGGMEALGFTPSIPTGPYCRLYERGQLALTGWTSPSEDRRSLMFFDLGGEDEVTVRALLGEVAALTNLEVQIDRWSNRK